MKLYVMRHSVREPSDDFDDAEEGDPEAELTDDGQEIATGMGQWMADNEEIPSIIYASPTVRTQQTAELVAKAIKDAGFVEPDVKTDVSIGPYMSVRALIQKLAEDESQTGAALITHRAAIKKGLEALAQDNGDNAKVDSPAAAELRILKVKRKSGKWKEKQRVRPSDIGFNDTY